jgi:hypothetical protein
MSTSGDAFVAVEYLEDWEQYEPRQWQSQFCLVRMLIGDG